MGMATPPKPSRLDVASHVALLQAAADWGRANGVTSPSLIDFEGLGYDPVALMKAQKGFHDRVFAAPQKDRTFDPPTRFSNETATAMRRAMGSLVNSPGWRRG